MQGDWTKNMKIVVMGAGAIGSFFGATLSEKHDVVLVGRKLHVDAIKKHGLKISGKTDLNVKILATESVSKVFSPVDLLILAVKSYDTETAIKSTKSLIDRNTVIMSLQNGLDNVEKIQKIVKPDKIIVCITTHGVVFSKLGVVEHTGIGKTVIGCLNNEKTQFIDNLIDSFNECGIKTTFSNDINKEIWIKAIVNSSINPVTALFKCKNGYLIKNPVLGKIVEKICKESTAIANKNGLKLSFSDMIKITKQVINETSENHSSMLQSIMQGKKTEIDSINGKLIDVGRTHGIETSLNEILTYSIKSIKN